MSGWRFRKWKKMTLVPFHYFCRKYNLIFLNGSIFQSPYFPIPLFSIWAWFATLWVECKLRNMAIQFNRFIKYLPKVVGALAVAAAKNNISAWVNVNYLMVFARESNLHDFLQRSSQYYKLLTPMIALSSVIVTCFARSTAVATCCWCWKLKIKIKLWIQFHCKLNSVKFVPFAD